MLNYFNYFKRIKFAAKVLVALISRVARTNFKLAAILNVGM